MFNQVAWCFTRWTAGSWEKMPLSRAVCLTAWCLTSLTVGERAGLKRTENSSGTSSSGRTAPYIHSSTAWLYSELSAAALCIHEQMESPTCVCLSVPPVASRCWPRTERSTFPCAMGRVGHRWTNRNESGTTAGRWLPWQQRHT